MKDLNKIVDLIIKELFNVNESQDMRQRISSQLMKSGINHEEINKTLNFIIKKMYEETKAPLVDKKLRILSDKERSCLSEDAHLSLYNYYYNDTISWKEMEEVINIIERMDRVVDVNGLNSLIEKVIFTKNMKKPRINSIYIN